MELLFQVIFFLWVTGKFRRWMTVNNWVLFYWIDNLLQNWPNPNEQLSDANWQFHVLPLYVFKLWSYWATDQLHHKEKKMNVKKEMLGSGTEFSARKIGIYNMYRRFSLGCQVVIPFDLAFTCLCPKGASSSSPHVAGCSVTDGCCAESKFAGASVPYSPVVWLFPASPKAKWHK